MSLPASNKLLHTIALFIFLDFSLLAFNFWIADQVAHDAVAINLAGRQRMLTQRIAKTLLQHRQFGSTESHLDIEQELRGAVLLFDRTLTGFERGGEVMGGDGKMVELRRVNSGHAAELVGQALKIWHPIREKIYPYTSQQTFIPQDVIDLVEQQMLQHNLTLLALMNELASSMESDSRGQANMLRSVQTVVFFLAMLNFFVIVRQLQARAREALSLGQHYAALASRDPLTGLFNRREFGYALERELASAQRRNSGMALLLLDLDEFKPVNDNYGHVAGDKVLCEVAARMTGIARSNDTVARMGGDEFVLICPDISDANSAAILSQRLIDAINQPINIGDRFVQVGASIGISLYSAQVRTADEMIRQADQAMYAVKQSGRNRYMIAAGK